MTNEEKRWIKCSRLLSPANCLTHPTAPLCGRVFLVWYFSTNLLRHYLFYSNN